MPRRPLMVYGRTLARLMTPAAAAAFVDARRAARGKGSVLVTLCETERAEQFDVDAVLNDVSPAQALDMLAIAAARIGVMHGIEASQAAIVGDEDIARMRQIGERIVDMTRNFGWWQMAYGGMRFFKAGATFRNSREHCVTMIVRAMVDARGMVKREEAA